ncbi:hypothetical protein [Ferrimonas sp. YFM]|uniref:hypothetical protein n=1 Tax=Ferrimonas sp. YFM TaxID=3028878 RepID=UPI0025722FAF|nr:hypothetical protein [Ferrimonas sp. YFM]BDY06981.1 hypothetical protein F0521_40220 [Ferrimonas sp. YFM]
MRLFSLILFLSLLAGCASKPINKDIDGGDGYILMGFILKSMSNKGTLFDDREPVTSITIKNIDTRESFKIDLVGNNFALKKVSPGVYCLNKITTYKNVSFKLCDKGRIAVNSGQIKNAGYWIAGVNYDNSRPMFKLFYKDTYKINLYENAAKIYSGDLTDFLKEQPNASIRNSAVGYWYTAKESEETYLLDSNGKVYQTDDFRNEGNLSLRKSLSWTEFDGSIDFNGKTSKYMAWKEKEKLKVMVEYSNGHGHRWVAYRNPLRNWDFGREFETPVVTYSRAALEKVAQNENKSVFIEVEYDAVDPSVSPLIGKRAFKRPVNRTVLRSNVSQESERDIVDDFFRWRFKEVGNKQKIVICLIKDSHPGECANLAGNYIEFRLGTPFPVAGYN